MEVWPAGKLIIHNISVNSMPFKLQMQGNMIKGLKNLALENMINSVHLAFFSKNGLPALIS